jgi:hypothetical protein
MTRLDFAPDNVFAATIKNLLADIEQLKRPQIVGASSLISHTITTGNTWDVNGVSVAPFVEKRYRVTLVPDPGQNDKPYAEFFFSYAVGNSDFFETVAWYPDPANATQDATRSFLLIFTNDFNTTTFFARFGIKSSHTGAITVTPL